jgi:hypothetical protein
MDNQSIVLTDKSVSYVAVSDFIKLYSTEKSDDNTPKKTLK